MSLSTIMLLYEEFYLKHFGCSEEQVEAILNQKYEDEYHVKDHGTKLVEALRLVTIYEDSTIGDYIKCESPALLSLMKEMLIK